VEGVPRQTWPEVPFTQLPWTLDTVAIIGGFAAEGTEASFDQVEIGGIAGDATGRLFLLDGAGKRVLAFDPEGLPLWSRGREGGGPGEFNTPAGLALGPADTIWVVDRGNRRITLFPPRPDAEPAEIALTDESSGLAGKMAVDRHGVVGVAMVFSFRPGEEVTYPPRRLLRIRRDGTIDDTLWTAPPPSFDRIELTTGNQVAIMLSQRSFSPGFFWERFSDGSFAVAQEADYEIRLLTPDGGERLRIRRDPPARAVTEADREKAREEAREQSADSSSPFVRQSIEERIEKMTFADRIPRITGLAVDGSDRLWVGVANELPGETSRIDVYDRDGHPLGEIRTAPILPTRFFGDSRAVLLDRDELDVQRVVVLQLIER
jgi:sugar lactone lactonase YvrE